jgi:hypothetical protein
MYDHKCYELVFSDGTKVVADEDHLWLTETHYERKNQARVLSKNDRCKTTEAAPQLRTTKQILDTLTITIGGVERPNHSVKLVSGPIQFKEQKLEVDPYVLGIWLGDGSTGHGSYCKPDRQIVEEIEKAGYVVTDYPDGKQHGVLGLITDLKKIGRPKEKRIPDQYLIGSSAQRLALLQGLMDTDGTVGKTGKCCFDNTNKNIADGVEKLAVSLGIRVSRQERYGKLYGVQKKLCYRVLFTTDVPVFRLKRKLDRIRPVALKAKHRTIVAVNPVPSVPVKCIKVDSPTHLFLCGEGCIPTHNTYGSALWMVTEAMTYPRLYCVWIAPTYLKCKIAYRYFKSFMPSDSSIDMMDGLLEIRLGNGSFVKFLHGKDAETTIEGEAVDRFCVDEAGKIGKQVWISLLTTITQTRGKGIVTGTPRGLTWYYEIARQAKMGDDPFFVYVNLKTEDSPFVSKEAIARAKKLLPPHLFSQYYLAEFISHSTTFGDLSTMWDDSVIYKPSMERFWIHDSSYRTGEMYHGVDVAKKQDYTVFYTVNSIGKLVGYCRFQLIPYPQQVIRLKTYLTNYFTDCDNTVRFDATGVGVAFEDMLNEAQLEADVQPICFTSKSKSEMITKAVLSVQSGWHKTPKIRRIAHEFGIYELSVTASGLHKYGAPEGEHDDVVSAAILAISGAYSNSCSSSAEEYLIAALNGENLDDVIGAYADLAMDGPDPFDVDDEDKEDHEFVFDYEDA